MACTCTACVSLCWKVPVLVPSVPIVVVVRLGNSVAMQMPVRVRLCAALMLEIEILGSRLLWMMVRISRLTRWCSLVPMWLAWPHLWRVTGALVTSEGR